MRPEPGSPWAPEQETAGLASLAESIGGGGGKAKTKAARTSGSSAAAQRPQDADRVPVRSRRLASGRPAPGSAETPSGG